METVSSPAVLLSEIYRLSRITPADADETIKDALRQLLVQWPKVIRAADVASDDELFFLNVSRALLAQAFTAAEERKFFEIDHSFTKQIVRAGLDLLIGHIDEFNTSANAYLVSNLSVIILVISTLVSGLWSADADLFAENDMCLLQAMRVYIDDNFENGELTMPFIGFVWNLTDNTTFVPLFLTAGYAASLVDWMKTSAKTCREDKHDALLAILLNMSRHDDGIDQLRTLDALSTVQQLPVTPDQLLQRSMIAAILGDVQQMHFQSIPYLEETVKITMKAAVSENHRHEGSHVSEPLTVLAKLFHNDEILLSTLRTFVTESSMIELLASVLTTFFPQLSRDNVASQNFTCVLALNILWLISCHREYCQIIRANDSLMSVVERAALNEQNFDETFMPRTMKSLQDAARAIRTNLELEAVDKCT